MVKIALDAGHGLFTPGKQTPDGIKEWILNDKVRDKVIKKLDGYDVEIINVDNDEGNIDESLSSRLSMYLKAGVDVFVSIHHNALLGSWNNATGVEVFVDEKATTADLKLADLVYSRMMKYTGLKGRGIKRANFAVINQNKIPAILCEGGFMDSTSDYEYITSDKGQEAYAQAVAEGLIAFFGLEKKKYKIIDIDGHYAEKHIKKLVDYGIVNGYPDKTFKPDNELTRAELALMVVNVLEKTLGHSLDAFMVFADTIGHWAEKSIHKLATIGIVNGFDDGTFKPDIPITRGQASIMACNLLNYCGVEMKSGNGYPDIINHYAERHIQSLKALGVINGYEDGTFKPENNITRGQAAIVIANCLTVLGK